MSSSTESLEFIISQISLYHDIKQTSLAIERIMKCNYSEIMELLKLNVLSMLFKCLIFQNKEYKGKIDLKPIVFAISKIAKLIGYGTMSFGTNPTSDSTRMFMLLGKDNFKSCPLIEALLKCTEPNLFMFIMSDFSLIEPFENCVCIFLEVLSLYHASFLFNSAKFLVDCHRTKFFSNFISIIETVIAASFILLPKASKQTVIQEWAIIVRTSRSTIAHKQLFSYDDSWNLLNLKIKSLNKISLKLDLIVQTLDDFAFFLYCLITYSCCPHEKKTFLLKKIVTEVDFNNAVKHTHEYLQLCLCLMFHSSRILLQHTPFNTIKASVTVTSLMTLIGIYLNDKFVNWKFHDQFAIWKDFIGKIRRRVDRDLATFKKFYPQFIAILQIAYSISSSESDKIVQDLLRSSECAIISYEKYCCSSRRFKGYTTIAEIILNYSTIVPGIIPENIPHSPPLRPLEAKSLDPLERLTLETFNLTDSPDEFFSPPVGLYARDISPYKNLKLNLPRSIISAMSPMNSIFHMDHDVKAHTTPDTSRSSPFSFATNLLNTPSTSTSYSARSSFNYNFYENPTTNYCYGCGKFEKFYQDFQTCSVCQKAFYCSKDCQIKDWSQHKLNCFK